jgi:hypothetical protein
MRARGRDHIVGRRELHSVRNYAAGAMPVARKLWLMPRDKLGKLRAQRPTDSVRAGKPLSMVLVSYGAG